MNLESKLKENDIKKILIADDTEANILAAKQYFNQVEMLGIKSEYASSAKEANDKIKRAYETQEKYSIVISDLNMEEPMSGLEVFREALKNDAAPFIATSRADDGRHGHFVFLYSLSPKKVSISAKKNDPETWAKVLEASLNAIETDTLHYAIKVSKEYGGTLYKSELFVDAVMDLTKKIIECEK